MNQWLIEKIDLSPPFDWIDPLIKMITTPLRYASRMIEAVPKGAVSILFRLRRMDG